MQRAVEERRQGEDGQKEERQGGTEETQVGGENTDQTDQEQRPEAEERGGSGNTESKRESQTDETVRSDRSASELTVPQEEKLEDLDTVILESRQFELEAERKGLTDQLNQGTGDQEGYQRPAKGSGWSDS